MTTILPLERITSKIYLIRRIKVMLDRDLADLYEVETAQLKRAVRRNMDRFPSDFMFELSKKELENWRCQFGISNPVKMGLRHTPMAFTEHGIAMLSSVLRSKKAIHVNIQIMRAFTRLRQVLLQNKQLRNEFEEMKRQTDNRFRIVFETLDQLLVVENKPKKRSGLKSKKQKPDMEERDKSIPTPFLPAGSMVGVRAIGTFSTFDS
jgi:hypothetical protein